MNVTILTTSFPEYQGDLAGVFVAHLVKALIRQSLEVRVIAPHSASTPTYELLDSIQVHRFRYFYPAKWQRVSYGYGIPANLKASLLAKIGLLPFLCSFFLTTLHWRKRTTVYHAQWIFSGLVAALGQRFHRKPIVLTVRGSDLNLAHGTFLRSVVQYILTRVTMITTVSEALRDKVLAFGIPPEKVHAIPNGINCQIFRPLERDDVRRTLQLPLDRKIVLWIGRFVTIKGVEFLIQAIPEVMTQEPKTLLVLIGDGELEDQIKASVEQLGVMDSVRFAGKILAEDIPLWLNAADIFILPSLNEGRPNVILEAMACETPVLATNVGGIPELVKDGQNGFLVPAKDSAKLAERLLDLLKNEHLRMKMGKIGRKMIFKMGLSWEQCAKQIKDIYQQIKDVPTNHTN